MSSSEDLHPLAESIYGFIVRYKRMNAGDSPTRREIMTALGVPSLSMVQHHLLELEAVGMISRPKRGRARMIAIPGARWVFDEVAARRNGQNKRASIRDVPGAADLPEEERKVRQRLGENGG